MHLPLPGVTQLTALYQLHYLDSELHEARQGEPVPLKRNAERKGEMNRGVGTEKEK